MYVLTFDGGENQYPLTAGEVDLLLREAVRVSIRVRGDDRRAVVRLVDDGASIIFPPGIDWRAVVRQPGGPFQA